MQINYIFSAKVRLYSCPRADKDLVNIFLFQFICKSTSLFKYILCYKEIENDYYRFLVQSKKKTIFNVNVALASLEFHVSVTSQKFCRQCHGVLKKRSNLQQNLQKSMRINYATCLKEVGLVFQPKNSLEGANLSWKRPRLESNSFSSSIGNE